MCHISKESIKSIEKDIEKYVEEAIDNYEVLIFIDGHRVILPVTRGEGYFEIKTTSAEIAWCLRDAVEEEEASRLRWAS